MNQTRITPAGYVVGGWRFAGVEQEFVAVLGVQARGEHIAMVSLASELVPRAVRVVDRDEGAEYGAAMLLYLAQIGFRPPGDGTHVRWPPIEDGVIVQDRRRWRRPCIASLTRVDLNQRVIPQAVKALVEDADIAPGSLLRSAMDTVLTRFRPGRSLRAEDEQLHDVVRWPIGALGYSLLDCAPRADVQEDVVSLAQRWGSAPTSFHLSNQLSDLINRAAHDGDADALRELLKLVRLGHVLTHAAIRHHQLRAFEDLRSLGGEMERLLEEASGLHELLYGQIPLLGSETWQFTLARNGRLRITLPEIVGLGRDAIGRSAWLNPLMVAYASRDASGREHHLDRLRQMLALLGATPEAVLMLPERSVWPETRGGETQDSVDLPEYADPGGTDPDRVLQRDDLWALVKKILTGPQWDAIYLCVLEGWTRPDAAESLGITPTALAQRLEGAHQALRRDPRLRDWAPR